MYLDWCPSHCNILGNDMADEAAKSGSIRGKQLKLKLTKTEVYGLTKRAKKSHLANTWTNHGHGFRWELSNELPTKITQYSDERQLDRIYTRLRLGRNGLKYNNQTHNEMGPLCPHCGEIEDSDHYFLKCPLHINHRETMLKTIKDKAPDITDITLKALLNPRPVQGSTIREAVFQYIRETDYLSQI